MAQIHWLNDAGGNFSAAADWSGGVVPGPSDDVTLGAFGAAPYKTALDLEDIGFVGAGEASYSGTAAKAC